MTSESEPGQAPDSIRVLRGFQKVLDRHGYGFQYAVQRRLNELALNGPTSWQFEASEFPVRVGSRETRIDFVYRRPSGLAYLVGECKRVNRGMDWGFFRVGGQRRRPDERELLVEALESTLHGQVRAVTIPYRLHQEYADLGRELRVAKDVEPDAGSGRSGIEDAVTQVLTGASGLSRVVSEDRGSLPTGRAIPILPVVFTTARLWYSETMLSAAVLPEGELSLADHAFGQVPWLPLQYHQSASLVSEVHRESRMESLADRLYQLHRRAVFIVNVNGIEAFMDWSLTVQG